MDFFLIFLSQILSLIQCQYSINHNIHYKTHDNYITDGSECKTDFECRETACCNDGKCKDSKECFKEVKKMYIIFTIIGVVFLLAIIGYCLISIGMGPIYPSIQHLAPIYFGKEASATVIGLQMAAAYVGTTFMPFIFGLIQSKTSMWAHPIYVGVFAIFNFIFIEIEFKIGDKNIVSNENENKEMTNKENSEGGNIKK